MKITLRNARRIEQSIGSKCKKIRDVLIRLTNATLSKFDEFPRKVHAMQEEADVALTLLVDLVDLRYAIREKIQEANLSSGISTSIVLEVAIKTKLELLSRVGIGEPMTPARLEVVSKRIASHDPSKSGGYSSSPDEIKIGSVLSEDTNKKLSEMRKEMERTLAYLSDNNLKENIGVTITLNSSEIELLRTHEFIK